MGILADDGSIAAKAIQIAAQQAGKPYVWGAGGPDAFDCSGYVHYCFALAGLPGTGNATAHSWVTYGMMLMGDGIAYGQEQPGDLIFPNAGHVGLCIGNGQMWNAPTTGIPVRVDKYNRPISIRRLCTPSNNAATGGITPAQLNLDPLSGIRDTLDSIGKTFSSFGHAATWLGTGHNWIRIFEVLSGATLLYLSTKVA